MNFYNFIHNANTNADELHIDGEIAADESWYGHVTAPRTFRQQLARLGDVTAANP